MPTYRRNSRNEVITLRALLKSAIRALHMNGCVVPRPIAIWLKAQRPVRKASHDLKADMTVDIVQQAIQRGDVDGI